MSISSVVTMGYGNGTLAGSVPGSVLIGYALAVVVVPRVFSMVIGLLDIQPAHEAKTSMDQSHSLQSIRIKG